MSKFTNYILHIKLSEFNCVLLNLIFISSNLTFIFSDYHEKCFLALSQIATSLAFEKCKQECQIVQIILVQGLCPLKIKITEFPCGFCLNFCINLYQMLWFGCCLGLSLMKFHNIFRYKQEVRCGSFLHFPVA